jgi:putative pyruvate formate lyase activating enzyme
MGTGEAAVDHRFLIECHEPAYKALERSGQLMERVEAAIAELADCRACPRDCGTDRLADETGTCHTGRHALVASAFPHHGEEDCLRGRNGSGTIFFTGCNLRCVFCQNADVSQRTTGQETTADKLADLMLRLQALDCHNINLVTPSTSSPRSSKPLRWRLPIDCDSPSSTTRARTTR